MGSGASAPAAPAANVVRVQPASQRTASSDDVGSEREHRPSRPLEIVPSHAAPSGSKKERKKDGSRKDKGGGREPENNINSSNNATSSQQPPAAAAAQPTQGSKKNKRAPPPPPDVQDFEMIVQADGTTLHIYTDDNTGQKYFMDWESSSWQPVGEEGALR